MSLAAESVEVVPEEVWFSDENGANFWAVVVALLLLRPLRPPRPPPAPGSPP